LTERLADCRMPRTLPLPLPQLPLPQLCPPSRVSGYPSPQPSATMLLRAMRDHGVSEDAPRRCLVVCDQPFEDRGMARAVGCEAIFHTGGSGKGDGLFDHWEALDEAEAARAKAEKAERAADKKAEKAEKEREKKRQRQQ
jgi:hypothetical protein